MLKGSQEQIEIFKRPRESGMTKHFKLTKETKVNFLGVTLFRIECTVDFKYAKKGDKGGWVESVDNLSGNAWVSGDAEVSGNARVYGDAWVYGNAWVYGDARVYGDAEVYGNARVYGDAWVYGNAWVSGNARVYGDAEVYGNARVYGDAKAENTPVLVTGLRYQVTITDKHMAIGCKIKTFAQWKKTPIKEIESNHGDGNLWKTWKPILMDIIKETREK